MSAHELIQCAGGGGGITALLTAAGDKLGDDGEEDDYTRSLHVKTRMLLCFTDNNVCIICVYNKIITFVFVSFFAFLVCFLFF